MSGPPGNDGLRRRRLSPPLAVAVGVAVSFGILKRARRAVRGNDASAPSHDEGITTSAASQLPSNTAVPPSPATANRAPRVKMTQPSEAWQRKTVIWFDIALQLIVWNLFFSYNRSFYTGITSIIVSIIVSFITVTLLMNIKARLGVFGTIVMLEGAFSVLIANFAAIYWGYGTASNFSVQLSHLDAIYFTVGTLTTAGSGNIAATSEITRGIQTLQMILDLILVVFAVTLVLSALSSRPAKEEDTSARSRAPDMTAR